VCGKLPKPICNSCIPNQVVQQSELFGLPLFFAGNLEGSLQKIIASYKDTQRIALEPVLVGMLNQVVGQMLERHSADVFAIPPRNRKNYQRRGFHPIEQLASHSLLKKLPRVNSSLNRPVADQRLLPARQRMGNLTMAFSLKPGKGDLVLVDDVLTTGATMAELGRAATQAGFRVSAICVIARR
jgi:predicted amidophosphoribosyltransferase